MRACFLPAIAVAAGCGRTPPPACPTPVAQPTSTDVQASDDVADPPAGETSSPDGLFACSHPRGDVVLTMRENFTAKDLVVAYIGVTCANVILPVELADRAYKGGFEGRLKSVELEPRFRALFDELGVALVREGGAVIVVDRAWLARRPGLILLQRVDTASVLLSSSPSIPPPLDAPPPPPPPPVVAGVTRVDDTHVIITRLAALDAIAAGGKGARIMPSTKNGQPNGVKLYAIRPSSIYASVGFMNGDTVHSINGVPITVATDFTLDKLFAAARVELAMTRRGKPITLWIDVN
ncbi:MAG TPA: hypothetical protein VM261_02995 [Kofleriaceae bacterium]|nr:hypothetical protein [Kofleriaceae bacterium]